MCAQNNLWMVKTLFNYEFGLEMIWICGCFKSEGSMIWLLYLCSMLFSGPISYCFYFIFTDIFVKYIFLNEYIKININVLYFLLWQPMSWLELVKCILILITGTKKSPIIHKNKIYFVYIYYNSDEREIDINNMISQMWPLKKEVSNFISHAADLMLVYKALS